MEWNIIPKVCPHVYYVLFHQPVIQSNNDIIPTGHPQLVTQSNHTFTQSLYIYSHISHSSPQPSYGKQQTRSRLLKAIQTDFSLALIEAGIMKHNTIHHWHTRERARGAATDKSTVSLEHTHTHTADTHNTYTHWHVRAGTLTNAAWHTRARARAHTHTHRVMKGPGKTDYSVAGEGVTKRAATEWTFWHVLSPRSDKTCRSEKTCRLCVKFHTFDHLSP